MKGQVDRGMIEHDSPGGEAMELTIVARSFACDA